VGATLGSITNSGMITVTGTGGSGVFMGGPTTFANTAGGSIISQQASGVIANGGGTISNDGTITGQVTGITVANGPGTVTNSGTIKGVVGVGLLFLGNFNNSLTNSGTISGNGPLVNGVATAVQFGSGNGTLTMLAGLISGGVTMENFANAVTLFTGSVINGFLNIGSSTAAMLTLDGSGTQVYSTAVTNTTMFSGALIKNGIGTWTLDESFLYGGGTTIAAGTLQLGNGGTSGSIVGNVFDNGTLVFNRSDAVTFPGVISGTGTVTQAGSGTTILTGDNIYGGGTTVTAGTLQLGNGGTTGSIIGNVADNGTLAFNRSDIVTFAGVISGTGSLAQAGIGTAILTADNTYSGGTTITAGKLQLGNGGTTGSIVGNVVDNGALVFERSDVVTFPGVISGTGSLAQAGTGNTILTGNNTYSGGTTITAGMLQLGNGGTTGSIVGNVVDNGALVFERSGD
jgi:autotransporter-associated beta strand protein